MSNLNNAPTHVISEQGDMGMWLTPINEQSNKSDKDKKENEDKK